MKMKVHIIVGAAEWEQDRLRYRRHRLAEFLLSRADTKEVIWLCPTPGQAEASITVLPNGIKQWKIPDLLPQKAFRFGRYMDRFYKKKAELFLKFLKQSCEHYSLCLWYTFPGFPLLADHFSWDKIVYDCSDLWASPISGKGSVVSRLRQRVIASAEERIIKGADLIFCTSDFLHQQVLAKLGTNYAAHVHTYENGVEFSLFSDEGEKADAARGFDGTILGFVGGLKPKLDFALMTKAAREKREWLFLLVGPDGTRRSSEFEELLQEPNVLWTGSVPPHEVPKYMNLIDIGIMPYKPSPYNNAVFPLKLFEYLAAGKPVVGVNLPSTRKYNEDVVYRHIEREADFLPACEELEKSVCQEEWRRRRIELAKTRDWNSILEGMYEIVVKEIPSLPASVV